VKRPPTTEWRVHGERTVYVSPWLEVHLADVELPSGRRLEHHVVRISPSAALLLHDPERGVLLIHRHRFITDTWGWEIPAGRIDPGETPAQAAAREALEETGWEPNAVQPLMRYQPTNGISDQVFHIFVADGATHVGDPTDAGESERVEWVTVESLRDLVQDGQMLDGLSLTSILYALAFDRI